MISIAQGKGGREGEGPAFYYLLPHYIVEKKPQEGKRGKGTVLIFGFS